MVPSTSKIAATSPDFSADTFLRFLRLWREGCVEALRAGARESRGHVRVGAVDVTVVQAHLGALLGACDPLPRVRSHVAFRHKRGEKAGYLEGGKLHLELSLDPSAAGEGPLWYLDRTPAGVAQGVLYKVVAHDVVEVAVADGVAFSRGDLEDLGLFGAADPGGQDRVHDVVYGDDVHVAFRVARELTQDALRERHDYWIGHPGALDPTRIGLPVAALYDGRPHYDERRLAPFGDHYSLCERLGEGVDIVPT